LPHADPRRDRIRFAWGAAGLEALAAAGTTRFVIVDVLSFTTCVAVACERGAAILPYRDDGTAVDYAHAQDAVLAGRRSDTSAPYSLSPRSLDCVPAGTKLVLPSPNGSALAFGAAQHSTVIAGCLRNQSAVSTFVDAHDDPVAVIAAGERWDDGTLRPCFEDLVGAGAIIALLHGARSPEAETAQAAFERVAGRLHESLAACGSGRELIARGFADDVTMAATLDASDCVPLLRGPAFVGARCARS
jgi:2-phosphosulfolactate phosphatase